MNAAKNTSGRLGALLLPTLLLTCLPISQAQQGQNQAQLAQDPGNDWRYREVPIGVGIGVAGAALSRIAGGCIAMCAYGTVCNPDTGACDPSSESVSGAPNAGGFGIPPAMLELGPPASDSGAPIPEIPRGPRDVSPAAPVIPPAPTCRLACGVDEYCSIDETGRAACRLKGPLPPTS